MKILDLRTGRITNAGRGYIPRAIRVIMGSSMSSNEDKDDNKDTTHKHDDMEHKNEGEHHEKNKKPYVEKKDMPYMREGGHVMNTPVQKDDSTYWHYVEVYKCDSDLVKATMMHLEDPDAPEGAGFVKWLAVQKHMGREIKWAEMM